MSSDEHHLLSDHVVRRSNRLLWIAGIVGDNKITLLSEHSTLGVDIGNRHFGAARHLLAQRGI